MATRQWRGDAPAVAQVTTITVTGTWATNDTATLTINGKSITFTVGATQTVAAVVAGLVALWNASTLPEFAEITASDDDPDIVLTADTAGVPFTVSVDETTAGDGELGTPSNDTEASGPNHWSTAANWSGAAVPVNSDAVVIDTGNVDILYGLDQSAVTLASLTITSGYTGKIGLPNVRSSGSSSYFEYRDKYLKVGATAVDIGQGEGAGSSRIKIDFGSVQTATRIHGSGTAAETGVPAILLLGTHASNTLLVTSGSVGVAFFAGETSTIATLTVGYRENQFGDSTVVCRSGVTLTTINQSGGTLDIASNFTTANVTGGELIVNGAATAGTLNLDAGNAIYRSTGTITTANVGSDATLDFRQNASARTVTNCNLYERGSILDPAKSVTWTNGIDLVRCGVADVTLDVGSHLTLTPSAI